MIFYSQRTIRPTQDNLCHIEDNMGRNKKEDSLLHRDLQRIFVTDFASISARLNKHLDNTKSKESLELCADGKFQRDKVLVNDLTDTLTASRRTTERSRDLPEYLTKLMYLATITRRQVAPPGILFHPNAQRHRPE